MMEAVELFKCLADKSRLQILSGLMEGPMYVELIAKRLALSPSTVSFHLKKLEAAGLLTSAKEQYYTVYALKEGALHQTIESFLHGEAKEKSVEEQREEDYRRKVLDSFFTYGKLKSIPVQRKKKLIVLEKIAELFEVGKRYTEKEVNLIIADINDDFCTLRRELIIEKLLERDHGVYWRTKEEGSGDQKERMENGNAFGAAWPDQAESAAAHVAFEGQADKPSKDTGAG
jgi:predicted transcriptional regulator